MLQNDIRSNYNPLPRAAGKTQYDDKAKPRPSYCIVPEDKEVVITVLYPFATAAGQTLSSNF